MALSDNILELGLLPMAGIPRLTPFSNEISVNIDRGSLMVVWFVRTVNHSWQQLISIVENAEESDFLVLFLQTLFEEVNRVNAQVVPRFFVDSLVLTISEMGLGNSRALPTPPLLVCCYCTSWRELLAAELLPFFERLSTGS